MAGIVQANTCSIRQKEGRLVSALQDHGSLCHNREGVTCGWDTDTGAAVLQR